MVQVPLASRLESFANYPVMVSSVVGLGYAVRIAVAALFRLHGCQAKGLTYYLG